MAEVKFEENRCKGCELCINACPKKILVKSKRTNTKGYNVVECNDMSKCIGCACCAIMCPDCVIEVSK